MAGTQSFPPQSLHKTPDVFVLVGSIGVLGPQWDFIRRYYIDTLLNRLGEGNPHRRPCVTYVEYCCGSPVSFDPSSVVGGHDETRGPPPDGIIMEDTLDLAAYRGYMSIIEMIDGLQYSNEDSYHLLHIAAGQHDTEISQFDVLPASWDPKWEHVSKSLAERRINLSMILTNPCPGLIQLFFATPARIRPQPWFNTNIEHTILLSGFVRTEVTAPNSSLHYGIQDVTDDQWSGTSTSQLAGSGAYTQVTATVPDPIQYEDLQPSSPTAMWPAHVPGAQGPTPMSWSVSHHGSGVDQQQPMTHGYTGAFEASGALVNASAGPAEHGVLRGTSDDGWIGRLCWGSTSIHAQAKAAEAIRKPKLSKWPGDLHLEPFADTKLSTLDKQAWMRGEKASMALLRCICETDNCNCDFAQLIEKLCNGYAIVKWEKQGRTLERLLLVPAGKVLLCAAFPDTGVPGRPKRKPPPPIRVSKSPPDRNKKPKDSPKKKKSQSGSVPKPIVAPTSLEGLYVEAAQNGVTLLQLEERQVGDHHPPHAEERALPEGDPFPIRYEGQANPFAQYQTTSPPEQQPCVQTPWDQQSVSLGVTGADGGLNDWPTDAVAAVRVAYMSSVDLGTTDPNAFGSDAGSSLGGYSNSENPVTWNSGHYDWPS